jgi:hypothetical protein
MGPHLNKLVSIASPSLSEESLDMEYLEALYQVRIEDLRDLLAVRNGFYAFEGALHVFPHGRPKQGGFSLNDWNREDLWRNEYGASVKGCLFFAEDVFAEQFAIQGDQVYRFDPETGDLAWMASSLNEWARLILDDYVTELGYESLLAWQRKNGILPLGKRLLPKIPFVLQGSYEDTNLYAGDPVESMRFRAYLADQIRNLPDGAKIQFHVTE